MALCGVASNCAGVEHSPRMDVRQKRARRLACFIGFNVLCGSDDRPPSGEGGYSQGGSSRACQSVNAEGPDDVRFLGFSLRGQLIKNWIESIECLFAEFGGIVESAQTASLTTSGARSFGIFHVPRPRVGNFPPSARVMVVLIICP